MTVSKFFATTSTRLTRIKQPMLMLLLLRFPKSFRQSQQRSINNKWYSRICSQMNGIFSYVFTKVTLSKTFLNRPIIPLLLGCVKATVSVLHFSYYLLMTFIPLWSVTNMLGYNVNIYKISVISHSCRDLVQHASRRWLGSKIQIGTQICWSHD